MAWNCQWHETCQWHEIANGVKLAKFVVNIVIKRARVMLDVNVFTNVLRLEGCWEKLGGSIDYCSERDKNRQITQGIRLSN